jgi:invasion protein IalB
MELPITLLRRSAMSISVALLGVAALTSEPFAQTPSKSAPKSTAPKAAPAAKQAVPAIGGVQPTLLGQYGVWGAYTASPGGKKLCFALAKPTSMKTNPANRPRDPAYAFISTRPAEKVKNEVSLMMGYGLKPGSDASVEIGGARFAMYTQGDGIWIKNAAEEERMIDALRKGADITVKGVSARGTETTDSYSLKGIAQALDRVAQDCK